MSKRVSSSDEVRLMKKASMMERYNLPNDGKCTLFLQRPFLYKLCSTNCQQVWKWTSVLRRNRCKCRCAVL